MALTLDVFQPARSQRLRLAVSRQRRLAVKQGDTPHGDDPAGRLVALSRPRLHRFRRGDEFPAEVHDSRNRRRRAAGRPLCAGQRGTVRRARRSPRRPGLELGGQFDPADGRPRRAAAAQFTRSRRTRISAVQAAACFFPPTDFLNYGGPGIDGVGAGPLTPLEAAFSSHTLDPAEWLQLGREISPIYFMTAQLPPTLIIHGDADTVVPLQQSETFVARAKAAGRQPSD